MSLAGILVVMYAAINRGAFDSPVFTSMYLGNAFYIYVGAITSGMGWAVVQDREHYTHAQIHLLGARRGALLPDWPGLPGW